ncbi:hypothetical protein [Helicobacter anatolicus]|uniref:hypothetical protein n=1 Tax=Helicobacter anatolicus TaxID=2905874 RepID=UPI001E658381|nr:hypothetical protein [Helicobacter anatolicus]MCE3039790.1 hypothetical protein [Helicobacter anatolicus]
MKKIFLWIMLLSLLQAAYVRDIKIASQEKYNDIFLIFQFPLQQKLDLKYDEEHKTYAIKGFSNKEMFLKNFLQGPIRQIIINAKANVLYIKPLAKSNYKLDIALSHDKKILRLRFIENQEKSLQFKEMKQGQVGVSPWQYIVVLIILLFLICVLLFVQRRLKRIKKLNPILHVKNYPIDLKTKIMEVQLHNRCYIVLESNKKILLLDRIALGSNNKLPKKNEK